ncbi:hypothetical protein SLEP1_g20150 [Rubroshorea leprosula]|uniref:Uncharacterized protein n=1 Tax=Rubroshorea leprosula TaxID=152421 RepID=A0AAV5J7R9_9ROSI|nr:hypothetical protein SLEP1_g20150 [Rubroshorea leprosula]
MADTGLILITPLMPEALSKATSIAAQVSFAPVLQKQLAGLAQSLTEIQDVARGAEQRQESDAAISFWLQKLNDAVYDAVDLLDECDYGMRVPQKEVETSIQRQKQVHAFFSMAKKFKMINESLAEIRKVVPFINLIIQLGEQNSATARPYYEMVQLLDSSEVVGREDDVSIIVNLLKYRKTRYPISGISIVGMPGVGKTTVARSVFRKAKEERLYDVVAWVCVSEDFNHQRILGEMLEYFHVHPNKNNTTAALLHDLGHQLENKTFLLILDDVRERDSHNWSDFASSFSQIVKTNGNAIALTTRCESVASVRGEQFRIRRYDLQSLSDDKCLEIIEKLVLRSSANALIPSEHSLPLVAKQCGGLPLVASAIGGTWSNQFECRNNTVLSVLKMRFFDYDARRLKKFISDLPNNFKTTTISVVITTSNKEVASIMGTIPLHEHELQKLADDDCWLIMEENVLRSSKRTSIKDPQLLSIGKDIAKQCGGLPLVAAVIGKHLGECLGERMGERLGDPIGVNEWSAIRDNKAWDAPHRQEILSQLKKSYDHLPLHLKKCFSFCSIFPKEKIVKISRDELVQCWMANGFLSQSNGSKSDEDVGNMYFDDLVSNYLLQDLDMDECGNIKFCKMHDEVHNLSLLSAKYETCIWPDTPQIEESVRHLRVKSNGNPQTVPEDVPQRLHSLFLDVDVLHLMPKKSRSLQSLKLAAADANELESSLGRLKYYMKYLDISESVIERLPKSVSKLYNLQTLRFTGCNSLEKLPSGIENLVSLRHIYFDDERHVPSSIGKLTSLQTLPLFVVGTENGRRVGELKYLNQLRGKLKLCKLELVSQPEASEAKLEEKGELIELQFVWNKNRANTNQDMGVLEGLRPHSNLKSLTIENYRGGNCPSWMMKDVSGSHASFQLNRLVKLELIDCDECGDISCLELIPELKVLNLKAMPNVKRIGRMAYHQSSSTESSSMASSSQGGGQSIKPFPALKKLELRNMTQLEEWTGAQGMVVFPCLEELHIQRCPELKKWWASSSQGEGESILPFPALRKLTFSNMTKLEKWTEARGMVVFDCLEELHILDCPELKAWWEDGSASPSLSILGIQSCRVVKLNIS